jgi:hypothetical protein
MKPAKRLQERFHIGIEPRFRDEVQKVSSQYISSRIRSIVAILFILHFIAVSCASATAYDFLRFTKPGNVFGVSPDLMSRSMNPWAPDNIWTLGEGWGFPPFYYRTKVPGVFDRTDFFYPLGRSEESTFQSKLKFDPFFENRWSKIPPFDGYSRVLTVYKGRSDLGQDYWGFFPFYGHMYRRFGVDRNFFFLFPLYYEYSFDDEHTTKFLWPIGTYANSPGRQSLKIWPLFGTDQIRRDYSSWFLFWPFIQKTEKFQGTEQFSSFLAAPFPVYVRQDDAYSTQTTLIWPFLSYYRHYASGHERYKFYPFVTYGSGGGLEELSLFFVYSYKRDRNKSSTSTDSDARVSVGGDSVFTEHKFLLINTVQKQYRKGLLVYSKYRFWPFAEYVWDLEKGSHLKIPEIIPIKHDWWDLNLGRLLRFVDLRETPITRELSMLFGLSKRTEIKSAPYIPGPPKPGDDDFAEMITGAFGKR